MRITTYITELIQFGLVAHSQLMLWESHAIFQIASLDLTIMKNAKFVTHESWSFNYLMISIEISIMTTIFQQLQYTVQNRGSHNLMLIIGNLDFRFSSINLTYLEIKTTTSQTKEHALIDVKSLNLEENMFL